MNPPDTEWIAFEAGLKPGIRITVEAAWLESLERRVAGAGFATTRAARPVVFPGRAPQEIVYVGRTAAAADELRALESKILPDLGGGSPAEETLECHRSLGRALGFPDCCVEAYLVRLARGVTTTRDGRSAHEDFVAVEDALTRTEKALGRLNPLLFERRVRFISHYPCRYDCPPSAAYAGRLHALLAARLPREAQEMRDALCTRIAITPDGGRCSGAEPPPEALVLDFHEF